MATTQPKPFSISFGSSKGKSGPAPPTNAKKRPHSALAEPDSDNEETSQPQLVSGFDQSTGGAVHISEPSQKDQLVIQPLKNRDWRAESRKKRGKNLLPAEVQAVRNGTARDTQTERDEVSTDAGLRFVGRVANDDTPMTNGVSTPTPAAVENVQPLTADEEAMNALLGKQKESTLAIPIAGSRQDEATEDDDLSEPEDKNEDDRFRADVASRPDSCTLAEYARIPVEEFGAAMLRGMQKGRPPDPSKEKTRLPKVEQRRPALLGIGAKEVPEDIGVELGAWGKAAKGKRKVDMTYNPILLKNSITGEMLTEEELEKKKTDADRTRNTDDWRDRRDGKTVKSVDQNREERLAIEDREKDRQRKNERNRSRDKDQKRYHDPSGHRKRDRSRDRRSPGRRHRSRSVERDRHRSRRERSRSRDGRHERRERDKYDRKYRSYQD